ncbi:MAG: hypothetical protein JWQ30_2753 [Sediminibacterium sp.]|nr:hypothetical protein [Sediminibacterium sp.]
MQALHNHGGELIAYQYLNMILHPESLEVLGLVLGNCVFDQEAKPLGKLFQQKVYNLSGEVLASKSEVSLPVPENMNITHCIMEAWKILLLIKDHSCPWVTAKNTWASASLAEAIYV